MLWNWYTIDACFLTSNWYIQNRGVFAASCVGVALLAVLLEAFRRLCRDYDAYIVRQLAAVNDKASSRPPRVTPVQQLVRTVLHTATFGVAYILMLLAMYYNGYIIISIFLGIAVGKFLCDWLTLDTARGVSCADEDGMAQCCG
jgi:copper transporter 1